MQSIDPKTTQQLAEEGDVNAQFELGTLRLGQDRYEDAVRWLRKAAEQGHLEAQCIYGSLLTEGLGTDQDLEAAAYWLRMAAEQGHSGAQVLLAQSFESGAGVPVNLGIAANWYQKAAEQGDKVAQFRLGQLHRKGSGVVQDLEQALGWLRKAAEAGCEDARVELVDCLLEMPERDMNEVMRWGRAAAESGSATGCYLLGKALEVPGPTYNIDEAVKWYRQAGEGGVTDAQMHLGKLYAQGLIVASNPQEAERWLNMAVNQGKAAESTQVKEASKSGSFMPFTVISEYPPGSIIDNKYFIMSLLGKGGMCMVYKAKHLLMEKSVALKMLLPETAADPSKVKRFQREAQTASKLAHPNVVTIYDLGVSPDGKPFIVMDYLEGDSLEYRLEQTGRLPLDKFLTVFIQVCAALDAAHEAGIVHRDVKPSNIMLIDFKGQKDFVKVVDFGLAKMYEQDESSHKLTKTGEVFGTLMYMSPEQCIGHPLDPRTDIYSTGCAMYESITGVPVHRGGTAYELMTKHLNTPPLPFKEASQTLVCPPEVEAVVMKALKKNREERHQTMTELQNELTALKAKFAP